MCWCETAETNSERRYRCSTKSGTPPRVIRPARVSCLEGVLTYKITIKHRTIIHGNDCLLMLYNNMLLNLGANILTEWVMWWNLQYVVLSQWACHFCSVSKLLLNRYSSSLSWHCCCANDTSCACTCLKPHHATQQQQTLQQPQLLFLMGLQRCHLARKRHMQQSPTQPSTRQNFSQYKALGHLASKRGIHKTTMLVNPTSNQAWHVRAPVLDKNTITVNQKNYCYAKLQLTLTPPPCFSHHNCFALLSKDKDNAPHPPHTSNCSNSKYGNLFARILMRCTTDRLLPA